jgi:fructose-bisphosphate aldolase class II
MAITGYFRKTAKENPAEFDPRKFAIPGMKAMEDLCADRFERFGTAGHAGKIKAMPLDKMATSYGNGELKQI